MERCVQEEPFEYRVSMPSPHLTQHTASIGTSQWDVIFPMIYDRVHST